MPIKWGARVKKSKTRPNIVQMKAIYIISYHIFKNNIDRDFHNNNNNNNSINTNRSYD
jgi:hypothetical protein